MKTLRILNLEDNPLDARLIRATLSREGVECDILRVETRNDFIAALEEGDHDLVLSDYQLPDFDGFSAMEASLERHPEVPFLIVSGMLGEELAIEALKRGATDYVLKDRLERLAPAVRRAVREARERAERRRAEADRERLFDLSLDLLCIAGTDGYFKRLNPAFQETLGYSREELHGRQFVDLVHPEDRGATLAEIENLRRGQTTVNFENRYIHKSGSVVWLAWKAVPVVGEGLIYASARDITENKRSEEALQMSEARFRNIVEQSPLSVQIFSPDGYTIRVNRAWEELWGVSLQDIEGYRILEDPQLVEKGIMPYIERAFAGEPSAIPPIQYVPEQSIPNLSEVSYRWVRAFIYPVKDEAGNIREVTLMHEDITERMRAEEELARLASFPELNPNPIIETSIAGGPTYLNPAAERVFPDMKVLGSRHSMLADLGEAARKIRNSHGRPFIREVEAGGRFYQQAISAVPENGLLRVYGLDITERRRAEEQTRREHALLDAVIEGTRSPVFVKDLEGRYLVVNSEAAKVLGGSRQDILGKTDAELFPSEAAAPLMAIDREVMDTGEVRRIEEMIPFEGEMRTFLSTKTAYRDHLGRVEGIIGVAHDITERREIEDALRDSEERFRSLVQNATDIVTVFDERGTVTYESPSMQRILGHRPGEMLGKSAFEFVHPEDLGVVMKSFDSLIEHPGVRPPIEFRIRHADGSWRSLESIANNLLNDPAVRGVVINSRDITERKQAEEALRSSEELYRAVVEQSSEGIYIFDPRTGRILETNSSLCNLLGYEVGEIRDLKIYDIVDHPREDIDENIRLALLEKNRFVGERRYRRKDGSVADVEVSGSVVSYGGGKAICAILRDITARKRAEETLREVREAERNRLARDLHDVILQDVIDAMHSLEITQMKAGEPPIKEDLEHEVGILERSIIGLRNIVYNLRLSESQKEYPFTRLLESLVRLNRQRAPECDISLRIEGGVPSSLAREGGMELMNIIREALVNIRRHSGARNASVTLRVEDGELRADIFDDGRGFDSVENGGGVGLLSMRERTGNLLGKLKVESAPGRGTRVALRVPMKSILDGD